jgi:cystathionine beta-lyase family protein involved in aluminum resistance
MNEKALNVSEFIERCDAECRPAFDRVECVERSNTRKVLSAFRKHEISQRHFAPSTGYGYGDVGRDALDRVFADLFGCEAALVRPQIASGTHALALCLQGLLRPGDTLLCGAGRPYDTLESVIGISGEAGSGSLRDYGIGYREAPLAEGRMDLNALARSMDESVKLVLLQRSRGYDWRPSLTLAEISEAAALVHRANPSALVMVDNCYGEFTDTKEPTEVGADLIAGSLIKNPGGGLAPTGGYVAGKREAVERVAYRLTCPGIGAEVGSYAAGYQPFFQGLFMAPGAVAQAVKTAILAARAFSQLGYAVHPAWDAPRSDIIQAIRFGAPAGLIAFCQAIQKTSPVDSQAVPEPWDMPGYQDPVIMAAGTFVAGASIELSADAPIRPPYIGYLQGALTYAHGRIAVESAVRALVGEG